MFSRFKKPDGSDAKPALRPVTPAPAAPAAGAPTPASVPRPAAPPPKPMLGQRPNTVPATPEAAAAEKEKKRKERLMELKVELHKKLLESLNLSALEHATEAQLRAEIAEITSETLSDMSVALNKDDRATLNQELYDEVMGLGPLEPLLKDETVSDILVNGPHRIFVERGGKLTLTDVTFKD